MARINSNIPSLIAQANLTRSNDQLSVRLQRLSTGLRINRGADDPAGLIISERIRSDIRGVEQGMANAERASSVISTTEASLVEVNDLLNSIKSLIVESANTGANSDEERNANQLQIDSAIDAITRISNSARFGGLRLLDGSQAYNISGVDTSEIAKAQVHGASLIGTTALDVEVEITNSAQVGALFVKGFYDSPTGANGVTLSATTLEISGSRGVEVIEFPSGQSLADIVNAVNNISSLTGVEAELIDPTDVTSGFVFKSTGYGGDEFVSVKRLGAPDSDDYFQTFKLTGAAAMPDYPPMPWTALEASNELTSANRDTGRDVEALINGSLATGNGLKLSVNTRSLSTELLLREAFATSPGSTSAFNVVSGGAMFQVGPEVVGQQQVHVGIQSVAASNLGGVLVDGSIQFLSSLKSGQDYSLRESVQSGDFTPANDILEQAIDEIAILRGRLGAFERNVLDPNTRSLQSAFENLSASKSKIRDADFALETSELTRAQILASSGTTVLALANQQAQTVLQLLG